MSGELLSETSASEHAAPMTTSRSATPPARSVRDSASSARLANRGWLTVTSLLTEYDPLQSHRHGADKARLRPRHDQVLELRSHQRLRPRQPLNNAIIGAEDTCRSQLQSLRRPSGAAL